MNRSHVLLIVAMLLFTVTVGYASKVERQIGINGCQGGMTYYLVYWKNYIIKICSSEHV